MGAETARLIKKPESEDTDEEAYQTIIIEKGLVEENSTRKI